MVTESSKGNARAAAQATPMEKAHACHTRQACMPAAWIQAADDAATAGASDEASPPSPQNIS